MHEPLQTVVGFAVFPVAIKFLCLSCRASRRTW